MATAQNTIQVSSTKKATVFISYAREDKEFVIYLRSKLSEVGIEPRGDWQLEPGVRYQEELHAAIISCDAFLFVISAASVVSEPCRLEVEFAVNQNKRLSPVVREDVPDDSVPAALRPIQYTFLRETDDFFASFAQLEKGIKSDLPWVKAHTYWLERASAWTERGRNRSSLLRGTDLQDAELWLATATSDITKDPRPTPLQTEYFAASRQNEKKRQRTLLGAVSAGLAITLVLLVFAIFQYRIADREKANAELSAMQARESEGKAKDALQNEQMARAETQTALEREQKALKSETAAKKKAIDAAEAERKARDAEVIARENAERATKEALQNLSQAYVEKADRALRDKDVGGGQVLLAHALALDDRRETREKLWEAKNQGTLLKWTSDYRPGGNAVVISKNGSRVALGCEDYNIRVWDTATGRVLHVLRGHTGHVVALTLDPSERLLASGGGDHSIRVWNLKTGEETRLLTGHDDDVLSLAFTKDGSKIVSVGKDNAVRVWDLAQGKLLRSIRLTVTPIKIAAFDRDGNLLAYFAGEEPIVRLLDVRTSAELQVFRGFNGEIESLSFSPDGRRLVAQDRGGNFKVWNLREPSFPVITEQKLEHTSQMTFSADGRALGFYHSFGSLQYLSVWDFESKRALYRFLVDTSLTKLSFSSDGNWVASGGDMLRLFRLDLNSEVIPITGHGHAVLDVAYSPDGQFIASTGLDNTVRLWDAARGQQLRVFQVPSPRNVVFSPDATMLAANNTGGKVYLWDVKTGAGITTFDDGKKVYVFGGSLSFNAAGDDLFEAYGGEEYSSWAIEPKKDPIFSAGRTTKGGNAVFSPDGMSLAICNSKTVKLTNLITHQEIVNKEQEDFTKGLAFSADGSTLAVANQSGVIRLYSTTDGQEVRALRSPGVSFNDLEFSQDGQRLVSSGYGEFKVWDVGTGTELFNIHALRTHKLWNEGVAFSPDGRYVAVGNDDGSVRLWTVEHSGELTLLRGHRNYINNLVYSANGEYLLSESDDLVQLWNAADALNPKLISVREAVKASSLSPDGKLLALVEDPHAVKVVNAVSDESLFELREEKGEVFKLVFSENGLLATASRVKDATGNYNEYRVSVWNAADGKKITEFADSLRWIECMAFASGNSDLLATGGPNGIRIWNARTGKIIATPKGHAGTVTGLTFSRDGKMLASSSRDGTIRLWSVEDSRELLTFYGHTNWVEAVTFVANDTMLVSAGTDDSVRFWDTHSGQQLFKLPTPVNSGPPNGSWLRRIAVNPNHPVIAVSTGDFSVRLWNLNEIIRFFQVKPTTLVEESQQQTGLRLSKLNIIQ